MSKVISKSTVTTTTEVYVVSFEGNTYEVIDYVNEKGKVIDTEVRYAKNGDEVIDEELKSTLISLVIDFE